MKGGRGTRCLAECGLDRVFCEVALEIRQMKTMSQEAQPNVSKNRMSKRKQKRQTKMPNDESRHRN